MGFTLVLAGKVFVVKENTDLDTLASKLRTFEISDVFEDGDREIDLETKVSELTLQADSLMGIFSQDQILQVFHRGQTIPVPHTLDAPFIFSEHDGKMLLIILEKKLRANNIANQLSKTLFITTGKIVVARIPPENLKKFHESNFEDTKVIFFDGVDIPNVNKLSLYGAVLGDTSLYTDYSSHGNIWYTVLKSKKYGYVVGLTRDSVVTIFSRLERQDFMSYVMNEVFPLIS